MTANAAVLDRRLDAPSALERRWRVRELGLWMFLGTVVMLFAAFTSALVVRKSSGDWLTFDLPAILRFNTMVILASSLVLEIARRAGRRSTRIAAGLLASTLVLGLIFLWGQVHAWRSLAASGVFLSTNPSSGFFYILTGAHLVHVLAALVVLVALLIKTVARGAEDEWPYHAGLTATFWHFLTTVWLYLLLVLNYL